MAKPEWGVKHTCHSCGARFYDLMRSPIVCSKCATVVEPKALLKQRRTSSLGAQIAAAKLAPVAMLPDLESESPPFDGIEEEKEASISAIDGGDDDESGQIEDASDLGDDDDDIAEVIVHSDEDL